MTTQSLRALVVEDDHSWQQIISEILSDCGLEVDVATNLNDATINLKLQPHRVAVVDQGRVIALGAPRELIASLGEPRVITHHGTLEDVFMALTGRHLRED